MTTVPLRRESVELPMRALGTWAARFAQAVGPGVVKELGAFARSAEPGSMITIKCTRDGFTVQVTGSIVSGRSQPMTADQVNAFLDELGWE